MKISFRSTAAAGAAISILMSGCSGAAGGQVPPMPQSQAVAQSSAISDVTPMTACTWTIVPTANPAQGIRYFNAVASTSTNDAWAVGSANFHTLAEHWNGSTFTTFPTPGQTLKHSAFSSVSEIAPNDVWTVGGYFDNNNIQQTLAAHWDGASWKMVPMPPAPAGSIGLGFGSIKMISHTNGWAVGVDLTGPFQKTLIEHWNGSTWTRVASPNDNSTANTLTALAVISPSNIWASGGASGQNSLVLHYDGVKWNISHTIGTTVTGLAAVSSSEVFDVGYNSIPQAYAEKYNGSSWAQQATPNLGSDPVQINAAATVSANEVFAVGFHGTQSSFKPFAMMWNGASWVQSQPVALDLQSDFQTPTAMTKRWLNESTATKPN